MRKSTAVCVVIMATSFALSVVCLFVSLGFYAISGTKEVAERIYTGEWDDIPEKFDFIDVEDKSFEIDLPNFHFIADQQHGRAKCHPRQLDSAAAVGGQREKNEAARRTSEVG